MAERIFTGGVASRGLASGIIVYHRAASAHATVQGLPAEERERLSQAIATAAGRLTRLTESETAMGNDDAGAILEFQIALLEDPELVQPAYEAVAAGAPAVGAWNQALDAQIAEFEASEDDYFRARAADLKDLRDRVSDLLTGAGGGLRTVREDSILVSKDLAPSRFLEADWTKYRGVALTGGSANGHVAILARARGIPLLIGLDVADLDLKDGSSAILDADNGRLIQQPTEDTWTYYTQRLDARRAAAAAVAEFLPKPARTGSGDRVRVYVNVDDLSLLDGLDPAHCDGIGLTRTEFLFYGGGGAADEDAQYAAYCRLLQWADGHPVTIRTLDAGGDKPIPGLTPEGETNPFLGLRGLRLSLAHPQVFRVQLRALARAAADGALKVMLPMVTAPHELTAARTLFEAEVAALTEAGIPARLPPLGIMVEVPAAALDIASFAADFFSIGSNDLVQYVTAAGRDCAAVADLYDPLNPAVLELIRRVAAHGADSGKDVSLCGDMAGDPRYLGPLLDAGLRHLSVAPAALAPVKAGIADYG